jgi:hypothetical protein
MFSLNHRVDRVVGFLSIRPNWDHPPTLSPAGKCPPPLGSGVGGTHSLAGEGGGVGVPIWTRGQTLWYCDFHLHVLAMTSVAGQKYSSAATASAMKRMTNHTEYTVMASGNRPSLWS